MTSKLKIDFVSDISCPWCAVGLAAMDEALRRVEAQVRHELRCHPFELNPRMPAGGQDLGEHLTEKYGSTPEQQAAIRDTLRQRGADAGFTFHPAGRGRIYNTFDAHRLLHWAGLESAEQQLALKRALLEACHRDQQAMDDHAVLLAAARSAGLDADRAQAVLASDDYAAEVRAEEAFYTGLGIHSVPVVIVNDEYLISGAQSVETYEQAFRQIADEAHAAGA